jgi:hypothetical protein
MRHLSANFGGGTPTFLARQEAFRYDADAREVLTWRPGGAFRMLRYNRSREM